MIKSSRVSEDQRRQMIADEAFLRAERRGFGGDAVSDWLEAEAVVDARLEQSADAAQPADTGSQHSAPVGQSVNDPLRSESGEQRTPTPAGSSDQRTWSSQLDEQLAMANERLRALRTRLADAKAGAREELSRDIEQLAKLRDRFRKKRDEIHRKGEGAGDKARQQAAEIWQDISQIFERIKPRKKSLRRE
jgi:DNA anti-recombination protein RmuC